MSAFQAPGQRLFIVAKHREADAAKAPENKQTADDNPEGATLCRMARDVMKHGLKPRCSSYDGDYLL